MEKYQVVDGDVNEIVNLLSKTCSCLVWQYDEFPCSHAIAALWKKNLSPVDYVSTYYTKITYKETYSLTVNPLGDKSFWDVCKVDGNVEVLPPIVRIAPGRPKKKRILSEGEERRTIKCSCCGQLGHNKRRCPNVPVAMDKSSKMKDL